MHAGISEERFENVWQRRALSPSEKPVDGGAALIDKARFGIVAGRLLVPRISPFRPTACDGEVLSPMR